MVNLRHELFGVEGGTLGPFALRGHEQSWRLAETLYDHVGCEKY